VPPAVPVRVTVAVPALEQYGEPAYEIVAPGTAVMVIEVVVVYNGQPPDAAIVYVTVYVPGVLVPKVTSPLAAFNVNPAVDE
jgi:hypothetical protein